jgi:hypothetical protein
MRRRLPAVAAGGLLGALVAAAIIAIALDHNPQCEFGCDGQWDYPYIARLGLFWFVPAAMVGASAYAALAWLWSRLRPK